MNGTCDNKSNEENCKSTHSYRFTKTSVCAKGVGFDSLCEAIANGITPTNEVSGGKDNCKSEELQLNSNLSNMFSTTVPDFLYVAIIILFRQCRLSLFYVVGIMLKKIEIVS